MPCCITQTPEPLNSEQNRGEQRDDQPRISTKGQRKLFWIKFKKQKPTFDIKWVTSQTQFKHWRSCQVFPETENIWRIQKFDGRKILEKIPQNHRARASFLSCYHSSLIYSCNTLNAHILYKTTGFLPVKHRSAVSGTGLRSCTVASISIKQAWQQDTNLTLQCSVQKLLSVLG